MSRDSDFSQQRHIRRFCNLKITSAKQGKYDSANKFINYSRPNECAHLGCEYIFKCFGKGKLKYFYGTVNNIFENF